MKLFEVIRKDYYRQAKSIRQLAEENHVHRRTVRQAISDAVPPERKPSKRKHVVMTAAICQTIDTWIEQDLKEPRKQRHTAKRVYERLVEEHQFQGSAASAAAYFCKKRQALGRVAKAFVPQVHLPGEEAEVDWYEAYVDFPTGRRKVQVFQMRACHSGREFHRAFYRQTQQAFLEAHVEAFEYFGGVFNYIRYDNLTSAVKKVLRGRKRIQTERFTALHSHYLFEPIFCLPGIQGAHEKGGVEQGVGRFRRQHFVPVPQCDDLDSLNQGLLEGCQKDDQRTIIGKKRTIAVDWEDEVAKLLTLPKTRFFTADLLNPTVNSKSFVRVKGNDYSVCVDWVGQTVEAQVDAETVQLIKQGKCIACHDRLYGQNECSAKLEHYLKLLRHKPGAFAQSLPLTQAREKGDWPAVYERYWQHLMTRHGKSKGTKELIDTLYWARDFDAAFIIGIIKLAFDQGVCDFQSIQMLTRQMLEPDIIVKPLTDLGALAAYERPQSSVKHFDALLVAGGAV